MSRGSLRVLGAFLAAAPLTAADEPVCATAACLELRAMTTGQIERLVR